jgi:hypothetical protein
MPRVLRPRWGDLATWGLWLMVALVMLLSPWRMTATTPSSQPALRPPSSPLVERLDLWRSPDDLPWFSPGLRARWQYAWHQVRRWWQALRAWGLLLFRLWGCRTLAEVIAVLTRRCIARYWGALPILYLLLEQLQVRTIINRHCSTESPIDHGTVALVLVLNRLIAPRPLYRVMDWLASTVLSDYLGVPATKFNDDRLGRTLDALAEHAQAIWQDIASQALLRYQIDLSVVFYDLTALVMTGEYTESDLVDYGFAHNTPSDEQKVKVGMVATRDGGIPCLFQPWSGRIADKATVQKNMEALQTLLHGRGWNTQQVLIVGDSANLNSELALAYANHQLKYLAGLPLLEKVHRTLVLTPTEAELYRLPLTGAERSRSITVPPATGAGSVRSRLSMTDARCSIAVWSSCRARCGLRSVNNGRKISTRCLPRSAKCKPRSGRSGIAPRSKCNAAPRPSCGTRPRGSWCRSKRCPPPKGGSPCAGGSTAPPWSQRCARMGVICWRPMSRG